MAKDPLPFSAGDEATEAFSFNAKNRAAQRVAERHAAAAIVEISEESVKAYRRLIRRAIRWGLPPRDVARLILRTRMLQKGSTATGGILGLTTKQNLSALNYRQTLIESGLSAGRVDELMEKYAKKKLRLRARTIARTETVSALNAGTIEGWKEAQGKGLLGKDATKEWITTPDARICAICEPMDGKTALISKAFSGAPGPPAHPACRCAIGIRDPGSGRADERGAKPKGAARAVPTPPARSWDVDKAAASTAEQREVCEEALDRAMLELQRLRETYPAMSQYQLSQMVAVYGDDLSAAATGASKAYGDYSVLGHRVRFRVTESVTKKFDWSNLTDTRWGLNYNFDSSVAGVVRHESGHGLWQRFMTQSQRDEFADIWQSHARDAARRKLADPNSTWKVISEYSGECPSEMFAEAFSAYTHPGYVQGTMPSNAEQYMSNLLRRRGLPEQAGQWDLESYSYTWAKRWRVKEGMPKP